MSSCTSIRLHRSARERDPPDFPSSGRQQRVDGGSFGVGGGALVHETEIAERRADGRAGRGRPELAQQDHIRAPSRELLADGVGTSAATGTNVPRDYAHASSIIGRDMYSASAQCVEPTNLLRFDRQAFLNILENNAVNEAILFKRLAEMLGNRLLELYPNIP